MTKYIMTIKKIKMKKVIKRGYKNLIDYPKTTFFYLFIIFLGLFTKFSQFIFEFNYNFYIHTPLFFTLILLTFTLKLGGRTFFIEIANSICFQYIFFGLISALYWKIFLIYFLFHIYCFYHSVFILISSLFFEGPKKIPNTFTNKFYFITVNLVTYCFIIYFLYYH